MPPRSISEILVNKVFRRALLAVAALPSAFAPVRAWSSATHQAITTAVVDSVASDPAFRMIFPEGKAARVRAESLECLLGKRASDPADGVSVGSFAAHLMLNPKPDGDSKLDGYHYAGLGDFALGEKAGDCDRIPGSEVEVGKILETYVLEPDWGMDRNVCGNHGQGLYPCDPVYANMEAFDGGIASQAFRHMYWPEGYYQAAAHAKARFIGALFVPFFLAEDLIDPNVGDEVALKHVKTAIGQAPDRSKEFFDRALLAAKAGHPYWAARFLAWSMHYAQDVAQPFHAAQIPGNKVKGRVGRVIISRDKTASRIAYYHLSFENYMDVNVNPATVAAGSKDWRTQGEAYWVTWNAAQFGLKHADEAGDAAVRFFVKAPSIPANDVEAYLEALPGKYQARPGDPPAAFAEIAAKCMAEAGSATKNLLWLLAAKSEAARGPTEKQLLGLRDRIGRAALALPP